jgi:hypothetical protein
VGVWWVIVSLSALTIVLVWLTVRCSVATVSIVALSMYVMTSVRMVSVTIVLVHGLLKLFTKEVVTGCCAWITQPHDSGFVVEVLPGLVFAEGFGTVEVWFEKSKGPPEGLYVGRGRNTVG